MSLAGSWVDLVAWVGREHCDGRRAKAHDGDVPEDDRKGRMMSGPEKPWVFVCILLESHVNEWKIPGKIP